MMPPSKMANSQGGSELGEGEWICQSCGNLNHAGRVVCNMRRCQAPKPEDRWTCFCGNENYAGRLVCNLRKCGMLKPGLKLQDLAKLAGAGLAPGALAGVVGFGGGAPVAQQPMMQPMMQPMVPQMRARKEQKPPPEGSWKCIECGNVNWPTREICNGKNGACAQPRATVDGGPPDEQPDPSPGPPATTPHGLAATLAGLMSSPGAKGASSKGGGMMGQGSVATNAPPGSWVCKSCMNVNFPNRTTCNARNCGMAREEVDGGPPAFHQNDALAAAASPGGGGGGGGGAGGAANAPAGSWTCDACGNINWPGRTSCNRRTCGLPRST